MNMTGLYVIIGMSSLSALLFYALIKLNDYEHRGILPFDRSGNKVAKAFRKGHHISQVTYEIAHRVVFVYDGQNVHYHDGKLYLSKLRYPSSDREIGYRLTYRNRLLFKRYLEIAAPTKLRLKLAKR
jgi:hypothetical protein